MKLEGDVGIDSQPRRHTRIGVPGSILRTPEERLAHFRFAHRLVHEAVVAAQPSRIGLAQQYFLVGVRNDRREIPA